MSDYRGNYRLVTKYCPGCGEAKQMPTRNTFCGRDCSSGKAAETKRIMDLLPQEVKQQGFDQDAFALALTSAITSVMSQFVPKVPEKKSWETNFADGWSVMVSDVHIPYHHISATKAVIQFFRRYKDSGLLKRLILNGDIFDAAALSRHMARKRAKSKGDLGAEMKAGLPWVTAMQECFEETVFLGGNHEEGRLQRVLANEGVGLPGEPLAFDNLLKFYGYKGIKFVQEPYITVGFGEGSVKIFHGEIYNKNTASTILERNLNESVSQGHTHRPQLYFSKGRFGAVNGNLLDKQKQDYMFDPNWTMGFTIFEHWNGGTEVNPYFVKITEDGEFSWCGEVFKGSQVKL
jgi:predicted phosphodiesterase